jgi:dihydrolipoamide dehydrogenase
MIEDEIDGRIRILFEPKYGEVLGVQIIAPHATDMIAEAAVLMSIEGTVFDLAKVIHAHPTVSEVFLEAGMGAVDKPIHI